MKKINELNFDDFRTLLQKNKMLFDEAYQHASETAYFLADDCLRDCPKHIYYEFDYNHKEFKISVFDYDFYYYIDKLNKMFCLFQDGDELLKKIEKAINLYDKYDNQYYYGINDTNAERIEKRLDEIREEIENEISTAIFNFSCAILEDDENIIQEAFDCEIFDGYTVDENGTAYKTIIKEYK